VHYGVEDFEQDIQNLREMGRLRLLSATHHPLTTSLQLIISISFVNYTEQLSLLKPFIENSLTRIFLLQVRLKYKPLIGFKLGLLAIAPLSKR
jgi:hypothetical protein